MSWTSRTGDLRRWLRLLALGAVISVAFVAAAAAALWLQDHLPRRTLWQARLYFLIGLELVFGFVALVTLLMTPVLGLLLYRARTRGLKRSAGARLLLLCVTMLLSLVAAEAAAAVWWQRSHRSSALPIGGWRRTRARQTEPELPAAPEKTRLPAEFPEETGDDDIDLVVVGESSAAGVPYDWWLSIGNLVSWQLEKIMPKLRIRVNILAAAGDTLEKQHEKLAKLTRRPDVLIVYAGHNEFAARFPWSREIRHYDDEKEPGLWELLVEQVESRSPVCRSIREEADKCRVAVPPPEAGYRKLVDEPVFTLAEDRILLHDFERRLETIVEFAQSAGALPILISPPANDFDYEPNRSYLPPQTPRHEREAFARDFLAARQLEEIDSRESLARYPALLKRQPGFAELHHRLARMYNRQENWDQAYLHALASRDLDGFPQRLPTRFQEVYRKVAARHRCTLIDGQFYFHKIGLHGLLDDHLFHDGIHPSLRGQLALAQAVLQALHDRKAIGWPKAAAVPMIDPSACAEKFKLTPWAWGKICNVGIMFYDLTAGARYDSTERVAKRHAFGQAMKEIEAGAAPECCRPAEHRPARSCPAHTGRGLHTRPLNPLIVVEPVDSSPDAGEKPFMTTPVLTPYEAVQVERIAAWKARRPGLIPRTFDAIKRPFDRLFDRIIPPFHAAKMLARADQAANWNLGLDLIKRVAGVDDIALLREGPLERCDRLVKKVEDISREVITTESLLAGVGGLATELLDLPAEIMLALRTVRRVAGCYGYKLDRPQDRILVLAVIGLSLQGDPRERSRIEKLIHEIEKETIPERRSGAARSAAGKQGEKRAGRRPRRTNRVVTS